MKKSQAAFIIGFLLLFLSLYLTIRNSARIDNLRTQVARESAMTGFAIRSISSGSIPFDSCSFKKDTAFFYKNGVFIGKTVTTIAKEQSVWARLIDIKNR